MGWLEQATVGQAVLVRPINRWAWGSYVETTISRVLKQYVETADGRKWDRASGWPRGERYGSRRLVDPADPEVQAMKAEAEEEQDRLRAKRSCEDRFRVLLQHGDVTAEGWRELEGAMSRLLSPPEKEEG